MTKINKSQIRERKIAKNRIKINGTADRPRISIYRTNRFISAQIVDDQNQKTLIAVSDKEIKEKKQLNKTQRAELAGELLAQKAKEKKIVNCVFDRRWYKYHGRVKSFAEGAKKAGLKF